MAKKKEKQVQKSNPRKAPAPKEKRAWLVPLLIFLFSVVLYYNTLDHEYVMDDGAMITDNATTKMGYKGMTQFFHESSVFGATKENYGTYRPFTMATYAFDWGFYKMQIDAEHPLKKPPTGQRWMHIIFYGLCCTMLFLVLKKLLKSYHPLIPAIAALIFAAHPLHTEVGAFIKSRDELLSMFLIFSSLFLLLKFLEDGVPIKRFISVFLFLVAMFSKESAITFVVIFPLALFFFTEKKPNEILKLMIPYVGCAIIYMIVRNRVLDADSGYMPVINNPLVDAHGLFGRLPVILFILLLNIKLLFYPHPLMWYYGYNQFPLEEYTWSNPWVLLSLAIHIALVVFCIKGLREKKLYSFLILFYLIGISITSNIFVLISALMAERFLFIPSIAFCIGIAYLLTKFLSKENMVRPSPALAVVTGGILLVFGGCTITRNNDWENNFTLFRSGAEVAHDSYRSSTAYAWELLKAGEAEKNDAAKRKDLFLSSREYFERATALYPKQYLDWYNLGVVRNYLGDSVGTEKAYMMAYQVNPKYVNTCYNLGVVHYRVHDYPGALKYWMEARNMNENFENLNFKVGLVYQYMKDYPNAIAYYERYYQLNPNNFDVVNNLSMVYSLVHNDAKTKEFVDKANQMRPKK